MKKVTKMLWNINYNSIITLKTITKNDDSNGAGQTPDQKELNMDQHEPKEASL